MANHGGLTLGSYQTLLKLASGGMGVVYVARHLAARGVERLVVVKRIHAHLLEDREVAAMLVDEARTSSQIRHPNVVPVDDAVESGSELMLVQPFIESVDLSALLKAAARAGEQLAPAVVSRVVGDLLAGLDGAHHAVDLRGEPLMLVHRDVSPHNVLVGSDGRGRVIDFGVARAARRLTVTQSGVLKGKVPYMAPEQLRRQPVDARADVYAAGVVLYEALAGRRPFDGDDEADTLLSVLMGDPEPVSRLAPGVPAAIDAVLERALARSPDSRYASAAELAEALASAIPPAPARDVAAVVERFAGEDLRARREQIKAALDALERPPAPEALAPGSPRAAPGSFPWRAAAGVLAVGLGGALAMALARREAPAPAPVTTASAPPGAGVASALDVPSAEAPTASAAPTSSSRAVPPVVVPPPPRRSGGLHKNPYARPD